MNNELYEIIGFVNKTYCVVVTVKTKSNGFVWQFVVVYGTAYNELKIEFIVELHDIMSNLS